MFHSRAHARVLSVHQKVGQSGCVFFKVCTIFLSNFGTMDPKAFLDIANTVTKLKMYPYFDVANYILMSLIVRDDNHPQATGEFYCTQ